MSHGSDAFHADPYNPNNSGGTHNFAGVTPHSITVPNRNSDIATGRLKGFANLLIFSIKGRIIKPSGINVCRAIPSNLLGTTLKI